MANSLGEPRYRHLDQASRSQPATVDGQPDLHRRCQMDRGCCLDSMDFYALPFRETTNYARDLGQPQEQYLRKDVAFKSKNAIDYAGEVPLVHGVRILYQYNMAKNGRGYGANFVRIGIPTRFLDKLVDRFSQTLRVDTRELVNRVFTSNGEFLYILTVGVNNWNNGVHHPSVNCDNAFPLSIVDSLNAASNDIYVCAELSLSLKYRGPKVHNGEGAPYRPVFELVKATLEEPAVDSLDPRYRWSRSNAHFNHDFYFPAAAYR
ncbi:hypothetical protein CF327_g5005 [Tilletia walkeri]|nr:hypothetical protein CF327_g5005 [Tilletia walkeri]